MTAEYRLELRVRNNWLLKRMAEKGYPSLSALAKAAGVSYVRLAEMVRFKLPPLTTEGKPRESVENICSVLGARIEELWPEQHLAQPMRKNSAMVELDAQELGNLLGPPEGGTPEQKLLADLSGPTITKMLGTLTPREERVLRLRFGLGSECEHTLEEVAEALVVTRERIRQIEAKAFRKLRHSSRVPLIRDMPLGEEMLRKRGERTRRQEHLAQVGSELEAAAQKRRKEQARLEWEKTLRLVKS